MKRYMNYGGRSFAAGGAMPMEQLTEFNEGGRHEENSLGGIPQGMNPDGQMNLVEEGETKFDSENYIYSDSLKIDKELAEAFNLSPKMVGKTFADASKTAGRKKSKREGDAIEMAANEKDLMNLMEAQEAFKQARIEEKLQEIAELDPNALPALMGQGQPQGGPQGDPAMGGQMQEAPMDEQAMMEQQMMAEQQGGGGQPSPEEMAMMEQQQNMAMGEQEGMMRSGGRLPKEVLKARVQSHMSPTEADAYVNSYGNGGYTTRSYAPGGFMGANAGMMNTGAMGMADPCPCGTPGCLPCAGEPNPTGITTENVSRPQAKGLDTNSRIGGMQFSPNLSFTEEAGFADDKVMQELRQHMLSNYGATATSGDPAYGTGDSGSTDNGGSDGSSTGGRDVTGGYATGNVKDSSSNSNLKGPRGGTRRPFDTENKWTWLSHHTSGNNRAGKKRYGPKLFQSRKMRTHEFGGNMMQSGQESGLNPMQGMNQASSMGGMLGGGLAGQNLNLNQGLASQMRKGGKMCYGCGGKMHNYGGRINQMASGGEIVAGIGSGLYGLGEGLLDTLTFGLTDELTDKGYEKLKSIGPDADGNAGDMIRGGANAAGAIGGAVLTGGATTGAAISEGSEGIGDTLGAVGKQTGNDTYTKIGKGVSGAGQLAGMLVGDAGGAAGAAGTAADAAGKAGKVAGTSSEMVSKLGVVPEMFETAEMTSNAANAATKAAKTAEMTSKFNKVGEIAQNDLVQMGINTGSQVIGASTQNSQEAQAAEFAAEEARKQRERDMLNYSRGFASGGYMGTRSFKGGGGLWANIHAKRARGEAPNKPGEEGYPTPKAIRASQNATGGRLYNTGGPLTLKKNVTNPDGTTIEQDIVYNSMEELLADTEMVNRYGGKEAVKQAFSDRFKKNKTLTDNIPTAITNPIGTIEDQVLNFAPEENPAMVSYIEQMKAQDMADQQEAIRVAEQPQYMPQVKQLPIMSPGILTMPENNQEMIIPNTPEPILEETDSKVKKSIEGVVNPKLIEDDNEVDVEVDQKDINRDFSFKESPGQFAAKMAAPMMNLYSGLFDKYDPRFEPEFQKIEAPKLNYTESINSIRRNAAKIKKSFNKVGSNPGNLLAVSQQTNSLEAQTIQQIDVINAKLEFEAGKLNNSQKQRLEKTKKELQLGFEEAKRKSLQAAAKQFQEIATANQANELALKYAAMGAEDIAEPDYKTLVEQLGELLKKRKENKNKKKK